MKKGIFRKKKKKKQKFNLLGLINYFFFQIVYPLMLWYLLNCLEYWLTYWSKLLGGLYFENNLETCNDERRGEFITAIKDSKE